MQVIRGLNNYPRSGEGSHPDDGCVATIGNFDGVHRGHQAIFKRVSEVATELGLVRSVVTFEPLPHEFFRPDGTVARLSTLRDKVDQIARCDIDRLLILRFNKAFSAQEPESFIENTLLDPLKIRHLVVGDDFRFGNERRGDFAMLQQVGQQRGFTVESFSTVVSPEISASQPANQRVSSSATRSALAAHEFGQVTELLGHPYTITGRVVRGQQLARQLGHPTANVWLKQFRPAIRGVFAVTAKRKTAAGQDSTDNSVNYTGVANLGERPTVNGKRLLLEVHLFDVAPDLYGELLSVSFHHFLRGEKKFDSLDELKDAIAADANTARDYFAAT